MVLIIVLMRLELKTVGLLVGNTNQFWKCRVVNLFNLKSTVLPFKIGSSGLVVGY